MITRDIGKAFVVRPLAIPPTGLSTLNERANAPASNLLDLTRIGLVWRTNGNGAPTIYVDFGTARSFNFIALLNTNAGPGYQIRYRAGATQAEVDGTATYDSGFAPVVSVYPDRPDESAFDLNPAPQYVHSHHDIPTLVSARWLRIDLGFPPGDFQAANLIIGEKMQTEFCYQPGFEHGIEDLGSISFNRWGTPSIAEGAIMRLIRLRFPWMSEAEFESDWRHLYERHGKTKPFYLCFDPLAGAWRNALTYFGWFSAPPAPTGGKIATKFEYEIAMTSMI